MNICMYVCTAQRIKYGRSAWANTVPALLLIYSMYVRTYTYVVLHLPRDPIHSTFTSFKELCPGVP
jgi:hypothetical protein